MTTSEDDDDDYRGEFHHTPPTGEVHCFDCGVVVNVEPEGVRASVEHLQNEPVAVGFLCDACARKRTQ